jgi:predicted Zn-dependent peptidase
MAVIISGSIDPEATIELIDRYFSRWEPRELPEPKVYEEAPLLEREQVTVEFDAEPYVMMGYRIAGRNHEDADTLLLVDMVLANSTAGLIDLNLVQSQKLQTAGASPLLQNDYGWQMFWATPKEGQTHEEAEALLLEQIEMVKRGEFDEAMLDGILARFMIDQKRSLESDTGRAARIHNSFLSGQDWSYTVAQLDRISRLTKADVVRVANKYYSDGFVVAYRVQGQHEVPEIEKPKIDSIPIDPTRQSPFAREILATTVQPIEPTYVVEGRDYTVNAYAPGVELVHTPNPINDLFTLSFVIDKGSRHAKPLGMAARLINQAGADGLSPEDTKRAWFALGTEMSVGASPNRTTITISGLDEHLDESLTLLFDLLRDPSAENQTLSDMVENTITSRQQDKKSHRTLAYAIRELSRYGEKSNYIDVLSDEELRALTVEELFAEVTSLLGLKHTIRYTGSLSVERVTAALRSHHDVGPDLADPPAFVTKPMRVPEQTELRYFDKEMAQSLIYVDTPGVFYDEAIIPYGDLFNRYFGGMGGVAYQELREARALAYAVGGGYYAASHPDENNSSVGMIGCQADKSVEALDGLVGLFDDLPLTPERFGKSKQALVTSYRTSKIGFRGVAGSVDAWARLGLEGDPRPARFEAIQRADLETLAGFYSDHVKGRPKYLTVVGDRKKIDLEQLSTLGEVIQVQEDDLFGY